jgi:hypothetical protein
MAGTKTFVNDSPATLQITLFIREGDEPLNQDGTVSFILIPVKQRSLPMEMI